MLLKNELKKMGFLEDSAEFILELEKKYAHKIEGLVEEYIKGLNDDLMIPYSGDEREKSYK